MTPPAPCPPGQGAGDGALWVFPAKEWVRSLPPPASPPLCSDPPLQGREEGRPSPSTPKGSRVCHHPPVCRWCSINTLNGTRLPAPGSWGGGGGWEDLPALKAASSVPPPAPRRRSSPGTAPSHSSPACPATRARDAGGSSARAPAGSRPVRARCGAPWRRGPAGAAPAGAALHRGRGGGRVRSLVLGAVGDSRSRARCTALKTGLKQDRSLIFDYSKGMLN